MICLRSYSSSKTKKDDSLTHGIGIHSQHAIACCSASYGLIWCLIYVIYVAEVLQCNLLERGSEWHLTYDDVRNLLR